MKSEFGLTRAIATARDVTDRSRQVQNLDGHFRPRSNSNEESQDPCRNDQHSDDRDSDDNSAAILEWRRLRASPSRHEDLQCLATLHVTQNVASGVIFRPTIGLIGLMKKAGTNRDNVERELPSSNAVTHVFECAIYHA